MCTIIRVIGIYVPKLLFQDPDVIAFIVTVVFNWRDRETERNGQPMQSKFSSFEDIRCLDAPLAERLLRYSEYLSADIPEISAAYTALIQRLTDAGAGRMAPKVGGLLPDFLLPDSEGKLHRLTDMVAGGPVVVSFNRGHWCAYCRLELLALAEVHSDIERHGGTVVSIMPERAGQTGQVKLDFALPFRILTDIDNGYALACGLMISLGTAVRDIYTSRGRNLAEFQGNDAWFVPIPATFVVGPDRRILGCYVNTDFTSRMAPSEILACLSSNY